MNLLRDILENVDKNNDKYNDFLFLTKLKTTYITDFDNDHNKITFFDDNKQIFESKYEVIAYYKKDKNIGHLTWAWADPYLGKNMSKLSRSILEYAFNIEPSNTDNIFIRGLLLKSHIKIKSNIYIELLLAIVSSLIKMPIIQQTDDNNNITFCCLIDYKKIPQIKSG